MPSPSMANTSRRCAARHNDKETAKPKLLASRTLVGCGWSSPSRTSNGSNAWSLEVRGVPPVFFPIGDENPFFLSITFPCYRTLVGLFGLLLATLFIDRITSKDFSLLDSKIWSWRNQQRRNQRQRRLNWPKLGAFGK